MGGTGTGSVPRREEGSTGKYQHAVEEVPEGAADTSPRECTVEYTFLGVFSAKN